MKPAAVSTRVLEPEEEGDARVVEIYPEGYVDDHEPGAPGIPAAAAGDPEELRGKLDALRKVASGGLAEGDLRAAAPRAVLMQRAEAEEGDDEKRLIRFVLSTEDVGRDGDLVRIAGWDLGPFRKNPVWLWSHRMGELPIGRVVEIVKDVAAKRLEGVVQFAGPELSAFADMIYRMHKARFLRATSVQWLPRRVTRPDDEQRQELGLGPYGVIHEKQELMEASSVTVPADRLALMKSVGEGAVGGLLAPADVLLAERTLGASTAGQDRETFAAFRAAWETLHRVVISETTIGRLRAVADRIETSGARVSDADASEPGRAPDEAVPGRRDLYADLFEDGGTVSRLNGIAQRLGG